MVHHRQILRVFVGMRAREHMHFNQFSIVFCSPAKVKQWLLCHLVVVATCMELENTIVINTKTWPRSNLNYTSPILIRTTRYSQLIPKTKMAVVTGNLTPLHIIPISIFFHILVLYKGLVLASFGIKVKFRILDIQQLIPPAVTTAIMTPKVVGHVDLLIVEI
jgi:hypothetical protein